RCVTSPQQTYHGTNSRSAPLQMRYTTWSHYSLPARNRLLPKRARLRNPRESDWYGPPLAIATGSHNGWPRTTDDGLVDYGLVLCHPRACLAREGSRGFAQPQCEREHRTLRF